MRYRIVNIISILVLTLLIGVHYFIHPVHLGYFIILMWVYLSVVFTGCIKLSLGFFMPVKCSAVSNEKVIALSFDDGPAAYSTQILDTLQKHNVPASFFCIGKNIPSNEKILIRINEEGHIIGNHSYSHYFWFDLWWARKMFADMQTMDKEVMKVTGLKPVLFRPPYGVMNPNLSIAIEWGKYTPIGWSIRSFDTRIKDKQMLLSRIMKQIKPGAIILLHDSMEITAAILPELIQQLTTQGYKIVRLDKMLNINAYA